ncbi:molybdenum cofactor biosynthesis protein [Lachnospiraceae bacterium]|nr:molybdenum cofactor biosynthesis protein [Lachnospiraceae bacterium]
MGRIEAICISKRRGTAKYQRKEAMLQENWGIVGDAHAGIWHRQVSLLAKEKIEAFRKAGATVAYGAFGENLVVSGIDLRMLPIGSRLQIGDVILLLTQIGKECHDHCAIFYEVGTCIMPKEGVFAKVVKGGRVQVGETIAVLPPDRERPLTAAVVTLSDRAAAGVYEDQSGECIVDMLKQAGYAVEERKLLPDHRQRLQQELIRLTDQRQVDLIVTTGGTGFSEKDVTPEATEAVCDRMAPGIAAALLMKGLEITPRAMLSRQTAGIRKKTLIVNLPGSPKACREGMEILLPALEHGLRILRGTEDG